MPGQRTGPQDTTPEARPNVVSNDTSTPSVQRDLGIARELAAAGIPVFCAYPDPEGRAASGRATGYKLPTTWETHSANPAYVGAWKPGLALCAVMGHGLDLVDIDPRNGGDPAALNGILPEVLGVATSPSGGFHLFVASMGVRTRDNALPGIDVKAGDPDGQGRGFAFIAPTVRESKTTGERVAYRWTRPPDLSRLGTGSPDCNLAAIVRAAHGKNGTGFTQPGGHSEGWTDPDIAQLIREGIPKGESQQPILRDVVARLVGQGYDRVVCWGIWQAIADRTPLTKPEWPWAEADFADMYDSAASKYGPRPSQAAEGSPADGPNAGPRDRLEFLPIAELCAQVDKAGPRQFLLRGIWPAGDYGVHAAEMKAQKTWNTADLAVSVASGTPWLGAIPIDQPGPVIMLAGEGGHASIVRRLRAICAARGLRLEDLPITVCARAPNLGNLAHLTQVQEAVTGASPRLVTLDPLYLSAGNASAGQLYEMGALLGRIQRLCEDAAAALFVVTHFNRKPGAGAQRITGAGPAEWGRVLITATIMSSHTDPITKATTKLVRLDVIGGEIPDQSLRVHRVIRADDPEDMNSALHCETTVLDGGADGGEDGMPPGKANLLAALRADPATPRTQKQLVDWIVGASHGLPLNGRPPANT